MEEFFGWTKKVATWQLFACGNLGKSLRYDRRRGRRGVTFSGALRTPNQTGLVAREGGLRKRRPGILSPRERGFVRSSYWTSSFDSSLLPVRFQISTVPSQAPAAMRLLSGLKQTE